MRLISNLKLKNQLEKICKNRLDVEIIIGIYTFEGDEIDEQQILLECKGIEIEITEMELQIEEYKINENLEKELNKIVKYLKDFRNIKTIKSSSY